MKIFQRLFHGNGKVDNTGSKIGNESPDASGCTKCGGLLYEHDSYSSNYICVNCGWETKTLPRGVDKTTIKELRRSPSPANRTKDREVAMEALRRSYHYQFTTSSERLTRRKTNGSEITIETVGIITDTGAAIKTAKACPEQKCIGWVNMSGEAGYVVVDGIAKDIPAPLDARSPVFSDNGKAFGYIIRLSKSKPFGVDVLVANMSEDRTANMIVEIPCDYATDLSFSPDGLQLAYCSWKNNEVVLHVNDSNYGPFDGMSTKIERPIVYSKTGRHFGFFGHRKGRAYAVVDGKEFGPYEDYKDVPFFSETGDRFLCDVKTEGKWCIVDAGKVGDLYDQTLFSPSMDSKGSHAAYSALNGRKCFVVVDNSVVETSDTSIIVPRLSPDGKRLAKIVCHEDERWDIIVDGEVMNTHVPPERVGVNSFVWSPDSRRIAYLCNTDEDAHIFVDKERIGPFDDLRPPGVVFSHDGQHIAAVVKVGTMYRLLKDAKLVDYSISSVGPVGTPSFLSDGSVRLAEVNALQRTVNWIQVW